MHIQISGQQIDIGDALRTHVTEKLQSGIAKYFDQPIDGTVTFTREGEGFACTASVHVFAGLTLFAEARAGDIYASFAEPQQIGLSAIAGLTHPVSRDDPFGVHVRLGPGRVLHAPLLPGVLQPVSIAAVQRLLPGRWAPVTLTRGTIAIDGERHVEFDAHQRLHVALDLQGPRSIAVERILRHAAQQGLLFDEPGPWPVA